ncbi:MAG TPA: DUF3857 domain-containing protein [Candidatus Krumholzibacterium sp.]|nr:DUF3857 domain-containing protein [Candidatus Krumholzibacterium sp.]
MAISNSNIFRENIRNLQRVVFAAVILSILVPAASFARSMGESGGHDLDALLKRAEAEFDLSAHDAVLLLESRKVTVNAVGEMKTRFHRVVWIGTGRAIRDHADLRVPWNSADSKLEVIKLRTWAGGRWWPDASEISGTAVVETLPDAVAHADDYSTMRETMLLHDGVELPCVMETEYEITEKKASVPGRDGVFVMQQVDPSVLVEFILETSEGVEPVFRSGNGAPGPESGSSEGDARVQNWTMEVVPRLGTPLLGDAASYAPYVAWSTWKDWASLRSAINAMFERSSSLGEFDEDIETMIEDVNANSHTVLERMEGVAALIEDNTRVVDYPSRFWMFEPRTAERVWATAYGTPLDRAVLAAALFEKAGLKAQRYLVSLSPVEIDLEVPGLSRFGDILLVGSSPGGVLVYDPSAGTLESVIGASSGRTYWRIGAVSQPEPRFDRGRNTYHIGLDLVLDEQLDLGGSGYINAGGASAPLLEVAAGDEGVTGFMSDLASSMIDSLEAVSVKPEKIDLLTVSVRFDVESGPLERDGRGMIRISINGPSGGILESLPDDLHLYEARRDAPVFLSAESSQSVKFSLDHGGRTVVYLPQDFELTNEAGTFRLVSSIEGDRLVVERSLELSSRTYSPEMWPQLRALLLEEKDEAHRAIILK